MGGIMSGRVASFFRNLLRKRTVEQALDEELQSAVELLTREKMKEGLSHPEARRQALIELGGVEQVKEEVRAIRSGRFFETFAQDLRFGLRTVAKSPGFTTVAVFTLALGIGATTAMFSVVNGVLLKPLPYPQPGRLIDVDYTLVRPGGAVEDTDLSQADYLTFRQYNRTFQDVGIYELGVTAAGLLVNITHSGPPERVPAVRVSDGLLRALGVRPLLGRLFMRTDDQPSSQDTAILTYGYWRSKFGGDRSIVGKTIEVDDQPRIIIGVLPERFVFLDKPTLALLLPIKLEHEAPGLFYDDFGGIARLKPGVTLAQANADVERMIPIRLRTFPAPGIKVANFERRLRPNLSPLKKEMIGEVDKVLWVLMGGIGLVLLIACANVANLLLVRLEGRRQELAIRVALGASRGRIRAELLVESLILAVLGGVLGLGLAYAAVRVLVAAAPPGLPRLSEVGLDGRVVLFALIVSLATTLVFGSIPAFKYVQQASLGIRLQAGGRSMSESRERRRASSLLVVVQVALAVVLLVSAGLMIRTFRALTNVNPGFAEPSEVQTFRVYIPDAQVHDPERVAHIEQEISDKIQAIPGISAVGVSRNLPMDGSGWIGACGRKGGTYSPSEPPPRCRMGFFGPGFLKTLGIPLLAGRDFTWSDAFNKLPVAIVSENLAREFWHDPAKAVGEQITSGGPSNWREVVGVVGDVRQDGLDKQPPPTLYLPMLVDQIDGVVSEGIQRDLAFAMRSPRAGSESLMNQVREAVRSVDPDLPLSAVHTLDFYGRNSTARVSFMLIMLSLAGGMALLLGAIGLYGVIAYSVSQRTHEIGIRMALGGQREDILRLILGQGTKLALIGVAIGIAAAIGLARFLSSLLYGVKPTDPLTFLGVTIVLVLVTLLACYMPARRAMRVDPMVALKYE
jgi:predicted permease